MSKPGRRVVGFFPLLSSWGLRLFISPEGLCALILGVGGGLLLLQTTSVTDRVVLVGDTLAIVATLLGVVVAAYALLVSLFADEYVALLNRARGGILAFLRPFMIAIGWQVGTLLLSVIYRATATDLESRLEGSVFVVWAFLFSFAMADVIALGRNVSLHGLYRARQIEDKDGPDAKGV